MQTWEDLIEQIDRIDDYLSVDDCRRFSCVARRFRLRFVETIFRRAVFAYTPTSDARWADPEFRRRVQRVSSKRLPLPDDLQLTGLSLSLTGMTPPVMAILEPLEELRLSIFTRRTHTLTVPTTLTRLTIWISRPVSITNLLQLTNLVELTLSNITRSNIEYTFPQLRRAVIPDYLIDPGFGFRHPKLDQLKIFGTTRANAGRISHLPSQLRRLHLERSVELAGIGFADRFTRFTRLTHLKGVSGVPNPTLFPESLTHLSLRCEQWAIRETDLPKNLTTLFVVSPRLTIESLPPTLTRLHLTHLLPPPPSSQDWGLFAVLCTIGYMCSRSEAVNSGRLGVLAWLTLPFVAGGISSSYQQFKWSPYVELLRHRWVTIDQWVGHGSYERLPSDIKPLVDPRHSELRVVEFED